MTNRRSPSPYLVLYSLGLAMILYVLSPPFVVWGVRLSGRDDLLEEGPLMTFYQPCLWLLEHSKLYEAYHFRMMILLRVPPTM